MRPIVLISSLLALIASLILLVADSAGPCEEMKPDRADYEYVLTCNGVETSSGTVSFSNHSHSFSFITEEPADTEGEEGTGDAEIEATQVSFAIARTTGDYSACSPAEGTGVFELAMAEAEVVIDLAPRLFSCRVFPQAEREECEVGPVLWPDPDGNMPEREGEQDPSCALVLTQAPAPEAQ